MVEIDLTITFDSDWHIGEGSGQPGHIDRLIRRHPNDGLPYVPAKTLTGIWRDASEQVARGLDDCDDDGPWQKWVLALFGGLDFAAERGDEMAERARNRPRPALLSVRPARFSPATRTWLIACPNLADSLTFIKPGVALKDGVAKEDHLRMEEVVIAGAVMEAKADLSLDGEALKTALALLWASARIVERLGGKRRRGLGKCNIEFVPRIDNNDEDWLEILNSNPGDPPEIKEDTCPEFISSSATPSYEKWHVVDLNLKLLTPVVAFDGEVGNVLRCRDYLPGTYLLGAINPWLRKTLGDQAFEAVSRGAVRVLNAYPEITSGRGLPVPLALHFEKEAGGLGKGGKVFNHLQGGENQKQHRKGFVVDAGLHTRPAYAETAMQTTTHGTIDDEYQRPTDRVGGVFTFEAIQAETRLRSELWIDKTYCGDLGNAISKLNGTYRLGKAKKDDYGQVELTATVRESLLSCPESEQYLTVWLASTLLLRNPNLRPAVDGELLRIELQAALKLQLENVNSFVRTDRSAGWHTGWGLPRPTLVGIAAGSCFKYKITNGSLTAIALTRLAQRGLGERRAEGFGEIRFNAPLLEAQFFEASPQEKEGGQRGGENSEFPDDKDAIVNTGDSPEFVKKLVYLAWHTAMRNRALALASDADERRKHHGWKSDKPNNSQMGALRALLEGHASNATITAWLEHLEGTKNRRDKWTWEGLKAVRQLCTKPDREWSRDGLSLITPEAGFVTLPDLSEESLKRQFLWDWIRTSWLAAMHAELRDREGEQRRKVVMGVN